MGAGQSAERTVEYVNPVPPLILSITPEVSYRLEEERNKQDSASAPQEPYICPKCEEAKEKVPEKSKGTLELTPYQKELLDIENESCAEKFKELENAVKKPYDWTKDHKEELQAKQSELLKCYKDNPGEALKCFANTQEYQNFILESQYQTILKHTQAAGDSNANEEVE